MDTNSNKTMCTAMTWAVALAVGAFAAVMLMVLGAWTFMQASFFGAIIFVALGAFISLTICRPLPAPVQPARAHTSVRVAAEPAQTPIATDQSVDVAGDPTPITPASLPELADTPPPTGTRPARLDEPRGEQPDDLKRIKGVGPKLEQYLHSLGFYHFDQVANWTEDEVAWVDQNLEGFNGRVTRDHWVEQARRLAAEEGDS